VFEQSFYNVFLQINILVFITNCCRFAAVEIWLVKEYIDSWPVKEQRAGRQRVDSWLVKEHKPGLIVGTLSTKVSLSLKV
jgi:hypothetical protein